MKILGILLYVVCLQMPSGQDQKDQSSRDMISFLNELDGDLERFSFFLKEIEISSGQANSLKKSLKSFQGKKVQALRELHEVRDKVTFERDRETQKQLEANLKKIESKLTDLHRQILKEFETTLLDHQFQRMRQAIKQRRVLQATGMESFEFPGTVQLRLSQDETLALRAAIKNEERRFNKSVIELKKKAWEKIMKRAPPELRKELRKVYKLVD